MSVGRDRHAAAADRPDRGYPLNDECSASSSIITPDELEVSFSRRYCSALG